MLQDHVTHCIAYDKAGQTQMSYLTLTPNSVSSLQFTVICNDVFGPLSLTRHKHGTGINLLTTVRATLLQQATICALSVW